MAERLPLAGFSVTIPHKQKVIRYLDVVDPLARRIGAVNTVWRRGGKWRGTNTDVAGITGPLAQMLRLKNSSVLIVGNGGSGAERGIRPGRRRRPRSPSSAATPTGVRALAKVCGAEALQREQLNSHHFDALVHATPLGHVPPRQRLFLRGQDSRRRGVRHGVQSGRDATAEARARAGPGGGAGFGDVPGTGGPPV